MEQWRGVGERERIRKRRVEEKGGREGEREGRKEGRRMRKKEGSRGQR